MYTSLKKEIKKEFRKDINYDIIILRAKRKKYINNVKIMYVIASTFVLLVGIVGVIRLKSQTHKEDMLLFDKFNVGIVTDEKENKNDVININKYLTTDMTDIDAKWVDADLIQEYRFLNNIYIPQFLQKQRQGKIYVRNSIDDVNYSIFKQYSIVFFDDSEPKDKSVSIDFSKNELLRNCIPLNFDLAEESIINGTKVKLFAGETKNDSTKINGEAYFEYNDYKFDIKAHRITQKDFIQIIKSIITEINVENL